MVTTVLGFAYRWIDRYCIPQDEPKEKNRQIQNKDLIYTQAEITITAACSDDATIGLAGVSSNRGLPQTYAQIDMNVFATLDDRFSRQILNSKWNSRGWTYQEALLSRRKLIFSNSLVYFQCRRGSFIESLDSPPEWNSDIFRHPLFSGCPATGRTSEIWDLIGDYTQRQLSYESDTLNAIQGIVHRFSTEFPSFEHAWGVPLVPTNRTNSDLFVEGLCWCPGTVGARRKDFPSWSWTGWSWKHIGRHAGRESIARNSNLWYQW